MNIVLFSIFLFCSCITSESDRKCFFENEEKYNSINALNISDNNIYIGGFRYQPHIESTYTILCLDENLDIVSETSYGNYNKGCRILSFCFDDKKNMYLVGLLNFDSQPKAYILKTDSNGVVLWEKELSQYQYDSFSNVVFYDNSLILTGKIHTPENFPFIDSGFVLNMTTEGEIVWIKNTAGVLGKQYLDVKNNNIYVSHMSRMRGSDIPQSKIMCFSLNGNTNWTTNLTETTTGIQKGVYLLGQFTTDNNIYIMCRSQNPFLEQIKTFCIDENGEIVNEIPTNNKNGTLQYVLSDYRLNRFPENPKRLNIYKQGNDFSMNIDSVKIGTSYLGCFNFKNKTYQYGNVEDVEKRTSHWFIEK